MGSHSTLFRTSSISKAFENDIYAQTAVSKKIFSVTRAHPCRLCEGSGMLAPWTTYLFYNLPIELESQDQ